MRLIQVIIIILAMTVSAFALEQTLFLDRCQIVNHPMDRTLPSKLLIHFQLPEGLSGKEIILGEITTSVGLRNIDRDSLLELNLYPFRTQPPIDNINYDNLETITDSLGAGVWTCHFDSTMSFKVDITEFIRAVASGNRANYGLVGTIDLLGEANIGVPENLNEAISHHAKVRIIYK